MTAGILSNERCLVTPTTMVAKARRKETMTNHKIYSSLLTLGLVFGAAGCTHTARGVKTDAEHIAEHAEAGAETFDVKTSLIADGRVDASNVNVDTYAKTRTVVLRGSVPSADQKRIAEEIARKEAKGYRVDNRLRVIPKS